MLGIKIPPYILALVTKTTTATIITAVPARAAPIPSGICRVKYVDLDSNDGKYHLQHSR